MRVEKTFGDAIRIFVMIDMFVMTPMFAGPEKHGILKGSRAKDEGEEADGEPGLECDVRKEPVIAKRDAHSGRGEEPEKKRDLKPVDPEKPNVSRHCGQSENESSNEKRARCPINAIGGKAKDHWTWRRALRRQPGIWLLI